MLLYITKLNKKYFNMNVTGWISERYAWIYSIEKYIHCRMSTREKMRIPRND